MHYNLRKSSKIHDQLPRFTDIRIHKRNIDDTPLVDDDEGEDRISQMMLPLLNDVLSLPLPTTWMY